LVPTARGGLRRLADDLGAWSCQITLWDDLRAVGPYSYAATGDRSLVTESGTFTDAVGDFSMDFVASAPYSYNHLSAGARSTTAPSARASTSSSRSKPSTRLRRHGHVPPRCRGRYRAAGADAPQTIELTYNFLMDTTGQSGVALSDITRVDVNRAPIVDLIAGEDDIDQASSTTAAAWRR
jgi:hypothetical protein